MKPSKADTTEAVDAFMAALEHPHKKEVQAIRALILGADDAIEEGVKWNAPSFRTTEYFATFHLRAKQGVQVVLHLGARVKAGGAKVNLDSPLITWLGKDRAMVTFSDGKDVKAKSKAFQQLISEWIHFV